MKEIDYDNVTEGRGDIRSSKVSRSRPHNLRTFQDDVAQMLAKQEFTKTQLIIAETDRREARGEKRLVKNEEHHLNTALFITALLFAFLLGVTSYILFGSSTKDDSPSNATGVVIDKKSAAIAIKIPFEDKLKRSEALSHAFAKTILANGQQKPLLFINSESTAELTTEEIFRAMAPWAPLVLIRSLEDRHEAGMVQTEQIAGYLLFNSSSPTNTRAGMIEWEPLMAENILPVLNPFIGNETVSSLLGVPFVDKKVDGNNVRVLQGSSGQTLIVYGMIDSKLIITTNERAFAQLSIK